jgi:hypothetical protein
MVADARQADPARADQRPRGEARFRADLTAYLGSPFSVNSPG